MVDQMNSRIARARIDQIWGRIGDSPVQEPIRSRGHGKTLGTCLERKDLACDHPGTRTPAAGKEEDVNAHKRNQGVASCLFIWTSGSDAGDDKLGKGHANRAKHQKRAATPAFDEPQAWDGAADVN